MKRIYVKCEKHEGMFQNKTLNRNDWLLVSWLNIKIQEYRIK